MLALQIQMLSQNRDLQAFFLGHTRFATSSGPSVADTHPHRFSKLSCVSVYVCVLCMCVCIDPCKCVPMYLCVYLRVCVCFLRVRVFPCTCIWKCACAGSNTRNVNLWNRSISGDAQPPAGTRAPKTLVRRRLWPVG